MLCKVKGSNKYYSRFTAPNGQRLCVSTRTEDKKLAQEYEDHLKEKLWRAHRLGQVSRTWEQAVVSYSLGKDISQQQWHLIILDKYCKGKNLEELESVRDQVVSDRLKEGVGNSTINRTLEVFRAVLKTAERKKWVEAPYIEMLTEPEGVIRYITREEAEKLIKELPNHLKDMVRFALATGLRDTNITGMEWSRVNLDRRLAWVESKDVKNKEAHQIPLNAEAILCLRRQQGVHERWVFTYQGNRVARINNWAWRKALQRAGIKNFRVHDLRHTWASWHVQNGTPLPVLQKLGGWKTLAMVMKYAHLSESHISAHVDNICRPFVVKEMAVAEDVNSSKSLETA